MRLIRAGLFLMAATFSTHARAQERDYCPTRPGFGTTACTISAGRVSIETGLADWTLQQDEQTRSDTILIGDTLVRLGLTGSIEAQVGWTPFGHMRDRDKAGGGIGHGNGVGDVLVGLKANLRSPDGSGLSFGLAPFVTLPVGRTPIGDGDWGAGLVVPVSYDLSKTVNLQLSPEIDAAVDDDGHGRHLAVGSVVGLGIALGKTVSGTIELQAIRDDDPAEASTQALAGLSFGWMPNPDLQLDAGANVGLNHASPDAELYVGVSRRF